MEASHIRAMTSEQLQSLSDLELERQLAHARNRRDAYRDGQVPRSVMFDLNRLALEQQRRRTR